MIFVAGLILAAPALVKPVAVVFGWILRLLFPREELIASGNLTRQPGRAAITASSVMISLAIIIAMIGLVTSVSAGFFNYLDKSMGSDFLIMPSSLLLSGGSVGAAPDLAQRIAQLPASICSNHTTCGSQSRQRCFVTGGRHRPCHLPQNFGLDVQLRRRNPGLCGTGQWTCHHRQWHLRRPEPMLKSAIGSC